MRFGLGAWGACGRPGAGDAVALAERDRGGRDIAERDRGGTEIAAASRWRGSEWTAAASR